MEARSLFIIAVMILAALVKASVKNTARRGGKTTGKPIGKNGERMAQTQDAPFRPASPRQDVPQCSSAAVYAAAGYAGRGVRRMRQYRRGSLCPR